MRHIGVCRVLSYKSIVSSKGYRERSVLERFSLMMKLKIVVPNQNIDELEVYLSISYMIKQRLKKTSSNETLSVDTPPYIVIR